eukprot:3490265-Rhodomonas_salina.1
MLRFIKGEYTLTKLRNDRTQLARSLHTVAQVGNAPPPPPPFPDMQCCSTGRASGVLPPSPPGTPCPLSPTHTLCRVRYLLRTRCAVSAISYAHAAVLRARAPPGP